MAKQFLRVTDTWTRLLEPMDKESFFVNVTGRTVRLHFTDDEVTDLDAIPDRASFPVGGSIAQLRVGQYKYVYGKAVVEPGADLTTSFLMMDHVRMFWPQTPVDREEFGAAMVQLMQLAERTTTEELNSVDNKIFHYRTQRQIRRSFGKTNLALARLHDIVHRIQLQLLEYYQMQSEDRELAADLRARYTAFDLLERHMRGLEQRFEAVTLGTDEHALELSTQMTEVLAKMNQQEQIIEQVNENHEALMRQNTQDHTSILEMQDQMRTFLNKFYSAESLVSNFADNYERLQAFMNSATAAQTHTAEQIDDIVTQLAELGSRIDNLNYSGGASPAELADLTESVTALQSDLNMLQNSLVSFSNTATLEELNSRFEEFNATATDAQKPVLAALKSQLTAILTNKSNIADLQEELADKISKQESMVLGPDSLDDPFTNLLVVSNTESSADEAVTDDVTLTE